MNEPRYLPGLCRILLHVLLLLRLLPNTTTRISRVLKRLDKYEMRCLPKMEP